jgi:hypothetical protein
VTQALDRVRQAARQRKKERFTALFHHINTDAPRAAFYALKRKAAPGVDGVTWKDYEADLEPRLEELHGRGQRGAYRPQPSCRTYIPKADGKQRPLAIAAGDLVMGFEHEADANRFLDAMRARFEEFALQLHPDKTRLIEFGRLAAANRKKRGSGKPETFNFLGFTHICAKTRQGGFLLRRKSRRDRVRRSLRRSRRRAIQGKSARPLDWLRPLASQRRRRAR